LTWIVAESLRTCDGFANVGDDAVAPPAYLVPKETEASGPAASDRAFGNHATHDAFVVGVGEREVRPVHARPARCAASQQSPGQALDVEAAVGNDDDIRVVTEVRTR